MYQYSLPWFTALLLAAARDAAASDDVGQRLAAIREQFTLSLYRWATALARGFVWVCGLRAGGPLSVCAVFRYGV